jgi:hypothetical protein
MTTKILAGWHSGGTVEINRDGITARWGFPWQKVEGRAWLEVERIEFAESSVSGKSAVGGAAVGALLAGPVGALVGGGIAAAVLKRREFTIFFRDGSKCLCKADKLEADNLRKLVFELDVNVNRLPATGEG